MFKRGSMGSDLVLPRLGRPVRSPCHERNASITGPRKIQMGHVNAPHLSRFIVNMAATIGVTMNCFPEPGLSLAEKAHWLRL